MLRDKISVCYNIGWAGHYTSIKNDVADALEELYTAKNKGKFSASI